jgi:hypothetical protein
MKYPPTPLNAEKLWYASAKASEGYPPVAKSAEVRPQHLCWEVEGLTLGSPSFI